MVVSRDIEAVSSFHEHMDEYRRQMRKGTVQKAYRGLMEFLMRLRSHFEGKYPAYAVSGSLYPGYMDMTYFALSPASLRARKLKLAVVLMHDTCRFEVWLAAANRQIQARYAKLLQASGWNKYRMPSPGKGVDAIIEHVLVEDPDFGDLPALMGQIEKGTLAFLKDVEGALSSRS